MAFSVDDLTAHIDRFLAENGPASIDAIIDHIASHGLTIDEDDLWDALDSHDESPTLTLLDGRLARLDLLAQDIEFTHRLTEPERNGEFIAIEPDLAPLALFVDDDGDLPLRSGATAVEVWPDMIDHETARDRGLDLDELPDAGILLLPEGTFTACTANPGDHIGLRYSPDGWEVFHAGDARPSDSDASMGRALRRVVDEHANESEPVMLVQAFWTAVALGNNPPTTRRLPPLTTMCANESLTVDGDWLAPDDFDFPDWRAAKRIESLQRYHDLTDDQALAALALVALCTRVDALLASALDRVETGESLDDLFEDSTPAVDPTLTSLPEEQFPESAPDTVEDDRPVVGASVAFLEDPEVAYAVWAESASKGLSPASLGLFAETMESLATAGSRAGLLWLQAKAREALGEALAAERLFHECLDLDSGFTHASRDLARYASDRGDATAGLEYLRRARVPTDDDLYVLLDEFARAGRADLGGKQPCWCGSGRKYKRCHLGKEQLPLEARGRWLWAKARVYVETIDRLIVVRLAEARSQHSTDRYALLTALGDDLVMGAALFEGGCLEDFVRDRGVLLPDDELALAEQWLLQERSVYEVERVRPGINIEVRDIRTGDRIVVSEKSASRQVKVGQFFCMLLLPAGDSIQIFGGAEPVALNQRRPLTDLLDGSPDPVEVVEFLSRRLAPPVLLNTEGEPIVMCEATVRVEDPFAAREYLDGHYVTMGDSGHEWMEEVITDGLPRVRAQFQLTDTELRIEANSEARFERAVSALQYAVPGCHIVSESRTPAGPMPRHSHQSVASVAAPNPGFFPASMAPQDPELAKILADVVRHHEENWLDDQIPALDGYTPRQAAADPTRRDDLIRLLDSFPPATGPGMMDADRLRAALEL